MNVNAVQNELLQLMSSPKYAPQRKRGLARELDISDEDYREFKELVQRLSDEGIIEERKKGKYWLPLQPEEGAGLTPAKFAPPKSKKKAAVTEEAPPEAKNEVPKGARVGRIDIKRGGMGFLLSDPPGHDLFIAEEDLGGAMSGDLVAVQMKRRVHSGGRRNRGGFRSFSQPAGHVVKILERARSRLVGTFFAHGQPRGHGLPVAIRVAGHVVPDTRGVFAQIDVLAKDVGDAADQDKVAVELVEADENNRSGKTPTARVVKIFGKAGEADADIAAIIENFGIHTSFPQEVLDHAESISSEISDSEMAQRTFYDHPITFTIDPPDAKDHDDAVALRREADGRYTLLVHIADVSHYVQEGSPIDIEARERATSVYLPGRVYPMLPAKLSSDLCSLREGQLRLTKTVSMTFGKNLTMQEVRIERSAIRSAAFLTYNQVKEGLETQNPEIVRSKEIYDALVEMREFAHQIREKRLATGSLELDLPEVRLVLDEKFEVAGWAKAEHHFAHELIEDMMLAANRAVAEYLVNNEIPGMFRIHEEPDPEALTKFADFCREFGIPIRPPYDRFKLNSVLERVKDKEYAHTIHMALLTSLKQARYSSDCLPHFALNFTRYLHFTSPIRRYPDLIVHRALDSRFEPGKAELPVLGKKRGGGDKGREYFKRIDFLRPLAAHCSLRERQAAGAESEVVKFRQMQFLRRNLKEAHPGIIKSVRDFGFFVELQDCFVEGLVRVQDLTDDYYVYHENQHLLQGRRNYRSFQLGDKVEVRVIDIDLAKKQVNLEVV